MKGHQRIRVLSNSLFEKRKLQQGYNKLQQECTPDQSMKTMLAIINFRDT